MAIFNKQAKEDNANTATGTTSKSAPHANMTQKSRSNSASEVTSIGQGVLVSGRIETNSDQHELHIDGNVEAEIHSKSIVKIGQNGSLAGDVYANRLVVSGVFKGNAVCEKIELIAGGKVEGKLTASTLTIDAQSSFQGQSTLKEKGSDPAQHRPPQKPTVPPTAINASPEKPK